MGKITFTFTEDGVSYDVNNVSGANILRAFMILAHDMKRDGLPDEIIEAAARGGIDEKTFNMFMGADESATN